MSSRIPFRGEGPVHSAIRRKSTIQNSTFIIHNYLSVFPCLPWLIICVSCILSDICVKKSVIISVICGLKNEQTNPFSKPVKTLQVILSYRLRTEDWRLQDCENEPKRTHLQVKYPAVLALRPIKSGLLLSDIVILKGLSFDR